jgi:hypothetical protein
MEFYDKQIEDWKRLNKNWHLCSSLEMAADMVVLQSSIKIWDIEETVVIEPERIVRYWTTFVRAFQQFNLG